MTREQDMNDKSKKRTVRLTLTVTYGHLESPDVLPDAQECHDQLEGLVQYAANRGLFTDNETDLVVEQFTTHVETVT